MKIEYIFKRLKEKKLYIALVLIFLLTMTLSLYMTHPVLYKAELVINPVSKKDHMSGLLSKFGGVASLAGIDLDEAESDSIIALHVLKSWPFLESFITKYDLKPLLFAVDSYNVNSEKLDFKKDLYDENEKRWLKSPFLLSESNEPSNFKSYEKLAKQISVKKSKEGGFFILSVEHASPVIAKTVLDNLLKELNEYFRIKEISKSRKKILYLEEKIKSTSLKEIRESFTSLVEEELRALMLAEVEDEFVFEPVSVVMKPTEKSSPLLPLYLTMWILISTLVICAYGLILSLRKENEK